MTTLFAVYEALWRDIHADGVWVRYSGLDADEDGSFAHDGCGGERAPEIQIRRPFYGEPEDEPSATLSTGEPADIESELLTLAHEYGHYLSYKGETPRATWDEYHVAVTHRDSVAEQEGWEAVPHAISHKEKQLICQEEILAWKLGRTFIPEALHLEYDEKARHGLHAHRHRLGLDELWPHDTPSSERRA